MSQNVRTTWNLSLIHIFRREVVSPILTIAGEAQRFAEDNVARLDLLEQIRKEDEIGTLARVIGKMETDIVQYVENLTAVTAEKERIGAELNVCLLYTSLQWRNLRISCSP